MLVESRVGIWCAVRLSTHYTNIQLHYIQDNTYATATNSLSHMTASLPPAYRDCHEKVIVRMNFLLSLKHSKKVTCFEFLDDTFTHLKMITINVHLCFSFVLGIHILFKWRHLHKPKHLCVCSWMDWLQVYNRYRENCSTFYHSTL